MEDAATRIRTALDALDAAIKAAVNQGIGYEEADRLWRRAESLTADLEEQILCGAPDYPDEDDEEE